MAITVAVHRLALGFTILGCLGCAEPPKPVVAEPQTSLPLIYAEDFEAGRQAWQVTDEKSWELLEEKENTALRISRRKSEYEPEVRSPHHIALLREIQVSDFVLTLLVRGPNNTGGHRDCCVFFGHRDPAHFYYVHLGAEPDKASGQIMVVDGAPRTPLTNNERPTPWTKQWHQVKVVRDSAAGTIEVYFDDMETPHMSVNDTRFPTGQIGIGSFDDINVFDDVRLYGR